MLGEEARAKAVNRHSVVLCELEAELLPPVTSVNLELIRGLLGLKEALPDPVLVRQALTLSAT